MIVKKKNPFIIFELNIKNEAFGIAQLEVRQKYPEPYLWGAFVMVGE